MMKPAFALGLAFCFSAGFSPAARAAEIMSNNFHMADPPKWVTRVRTEKVVDHMQQYLEWDIHRIEVIFHSDQAEFEKLHGLGPTVLAISRKSENAIHLGPKIDSSNFDKVFGHEVVHIISFQKYKETIPKWLEEGLANYLSKAATPDYKWLASQPFPADVRGLTHPFGGTVDQIRYHYDASEALIEMIAKKCDLNNLIRVSVGEKMEDRIVTFCEIKDLNAEFRKWIAAKSGKKV